MLLMVETERLTNSSEKLKKLAESVGNCASKVKKITSQIEMTLPAEAKLKNASEKVVKKTGVLRSDFISMSKMLSECAEIYEKCQKELLNAVQALETNVISAIHDPHATKAFDSTGLYGGYQGAPAADYLKYASIVRKYFPEMTDSEVEQYLQKLNREGCGYVAMINTAFVYFHGREDEFKEAFGFDMYDANGEPNFNELLVDFYCSQDNHNKKSFLFWSWDVVNTKEDWKDDNKNGVKDPGEEAEHGYGMTLKQCEYRWEQYCKAHGINVDVINNVKVTPSNFEKLSYDGMVTIMAGNFNLYDMNGNMIHSNVGGHFMTLMGFTEDGKYIVSSWGDKYIMDPAEMNFKDKNTFLYFQHVVYK